MAEMDEEFKAYEEFNRRQEERRRLMEDARNRIIESNDDGNTDPLWPLLYAIEGLQKRVDELEFPAKMKAAEFRRKAAEKKWTEERQAKPQEQKIVANTCSECGGSGSIFHVLPDDVGSPFEVKCEHCKGTGMESGE